MTNGGEAGPVKETPSPAMANYAIGLETLERAPEAVFGVAVDPFKPRDVVIPASISSLPPKCPVCRTLLYPITANPVGDLLFECLNADGYEAVFRMGAQAWESRPGRPVERWGPPYFGAEPPLPPQQAKAAAEAYAAGQLPLEVTEKASAPPAATVSAQPPSVDPDDPGTEWLLIVDAAALVNKPTIEVYNLVRRKAVPVQRIKGRVFVSADAVIKALGTG